MGLRRTLSPSAQRELYSGNHEIQLRRPFLLGFGFFGVSVLNALYNSYVPIFLQDKFDLPARVIGIFMALDNIAALFIQPSVGPWSDGVRTKSGGACLSF